MIALSSLISRDYLEAQKIMHAQPRGYGGRGDAWANTVIDLAQRYDAGSLLDYGCGQGALARALRTAGLACREYDPAIPGKDAPPVFADMVVCTDVLEHIEPDRLDLVLTHLRALARKVVFVVIALRPANKLLPNGQNAHLIIENKVWWRARVELAGFTVRGAPAVWPEKRPGKCWAAVLKP